MTFVNDFIFIFISTTCLKQSQKTQEQRSNVPVRVFDVQKDVKRRRSTASSIYYVLFFSTNFRPVIRRGRLEEVDLEHCQTSVMELFAKIEEYRLTVNYFRRKFYFRCLNGS